MERPSVLSMLAQSARSLGADGSITAVCVVALLACILVPLPTPLLDVLLVLNMVLALVVLLRGLSVSEPVRLYSFPALLLFATLFRLALNVSSTRLILSQGDQGIGAAGAVIRSFGSFVVRGDFFVGVILFAVIAVVNFVVIARGSARVAEVAARFVLDSLPGRQLAIDADLRAGSITREEAEQRRAHLSQESQFFGAMDGAMKFVQGDAVAGMVIVAINALGGIAIGKSRGMELSEAVNTFGVLTIGEGLVNILPSLLMSLAAGIIVTHVSGPGKRGTGGAVAAQLTGDPRVLNLAAVSLIFFGLLPGLPLPPFLFVALAVFGLSAVIVRNRAAGSAVWSIEEISGETSPTGPFKELPPAPMVLLPWSGTELNGDGRAHAVSRISQEVHTLTLEVEPYGLGAYLERIDRAKGERSLEARFEEIASTVCAERGLPKPGLTVQFDPVLERGAYRIAVREQVIRRGRIDESLLLVAAGPSVVSLFGGVPISPGRHPLDGRGGTWIRPEQGRADGPSVNAMRRLGLDVFSAADVLIFEAIGAILQSPEDVFGLEEVKTAIVRLRETAPHLVEEVFDRQVLSYAEMAEIVRRLIRERISVRDMKRIVEAVSEFSALHADAEDRQRWLDEAHAFVRLVFVRALVHPVGGSPGRIRVFLLSPEVEEEFRGAKDEWEYSRARIPLEPQIESGLRENAKRLFQPVIDRGNVPVVLLCAADIRSAVQEFFYRSLGSGDWLRTLSYQEIESAGIPESVGVLGA